MNRILGAALVSVLAAALSGCGNKETVKETHTLSTPTGEKTVDKETTVKTNSDGTKTETKNTETTTETKK